MVKQCEHYNLYIKTANMIELLTGVKIVYSQEKSHIESIHDALKPIIEGEINMPKSIFELKTELNNFIADKPQYAEYQKYIEDRLNRAGSSNNRMVVLYEMMAKKVNELASAIIQLINQK